MKLHRVVILCLASAFASAAHADTLTYLYVTNAVFNDGGTLTGSITLDTTLGTVTSQALGASQNGKYYTFNSPGTSVAVIDAAPGSKNYTEIDLTNAGAELAIDLPVANLIGYGGGLLCVGMYSSCVVNGYVPLAEPTHLEAAEATYLTSGALLTPEPSSMVLLATGLLGVVGTVRRRMRKG